MERKRALLLCAGLLALALGLYWFLRESRNRPGDTWADRDGAVPEESGERGITYSPEDEQEDAGEDDGEADDEGMKVNPQLLARVQEIAERFRTANLTPEQRRRLYRELVRLLKSHEDDGAAATIAAYLRTGEDAETGLPFAVGNDGVLDLAPSIRTALLDVIATLDPHLSLEVAREVMDALTRPDEYALGLRNLSWYDFEGDMHGEMQERFSAMLDQNEWLADPSAGFLEAFDVAVELSTEAAFEDIASVTRLEDKQGNPADEGVARAAFMALDRIMLRNPDMVVERFLQDGDSFLDYAPNHRASLLSRLDLGKEADRSAFAKYLSGANHGEGELEYFSELFPNGNYFYGDRLVSSQEEVLSIADIQNRDRATLSAIDGMVARGEIGGPHVERIRERLRDYIDQISDPIPEDPSLRLE